MMADSEAKKNWDKANIWMLCLKIHRKNDADIVAFLESRGADKQKSIKAAIREYMKNHEGEEI